MLKVALFVLAIIMIIVGIKKLKDRDTTLGIMTFCVVLLYGVIATILYNENIIYEWIETRDSFSFLNGGLLLFLILSPVLLLILSNVILKREGMILRVIITVVISLIIIGLAQQFKFPDKMWYYLLYVGIIFLSQINTLFGPLKDSGDPPKDIWDSYRSEFE